MLPVTNGKEFSRQIWARHVFETLYQFFDFSVGGLLSCHDVDEVQSLFSIFRCPFVKDTRKPGIPQARYLHRHQARITRTGTGSLIPFSCKLRDSNLLTSMCAWVKAFSLTTISPAAACLLIFTLDRAQE